MTSHDKPGLRVSRNCGNCRSVKRRCDRQRPHCGQCIRLREKCPGYRDEWELVFRNDTDKTIKRVKEKKAKSAATNDIPPPTCSLSPTVDDLGVNYFVRHFVIGGRANARGCLNYIPSIYHADGEQSTLVASMSAVGLVALANATQHPELASHARVKYLEAIRNVNAALASPVESVKDSTLMSVISLGVFEHVSGYESWARHVRGAAALLVARGKRQFTTPVTIRMFHQVRTDLVLACFRGDEAFPEDILELQGEAAKYADTSTSWWIMGVLGTRCVIVLTDVRENMHREGFPWSDLLDEASLLARDFEDLAAILAVQEPYIITRLSNSGSNMIYNGIYAVFKDAWAIRLWANLRTLQMVVYEIIYWILVKLLATDLEAAVREHTKVKLHGTMNTLSKLGDDILAIVPQAMELVCSSPEPGPPIGLSVQGSVSGGYLMIWGLFMIGKSAATKRETRKFVIRLLQDIGRNTGMSVALQVVQAAIEIDKKRD
ncbi:hypothetical protein DPV78_005290 [Talaromyces pinophilus]|nr:hypothetical protein DPV78_005290 [Talaromyces pinophilus]